MADLDPPENFLDQFREGDKWVNPDGTLTSTARHFLEQGFFFNNSVWEKLGGPEDAIAATAIRESYAWDTVNDDTGLNGAKVQQLYPYIEHAPKEWRAVTVTGGTYTALDHDFINGKSHATVIFPQYPPENAVISIRVGDNTAIKLLGNGKMINGCSTGTIKGKERSIDFYYFIDTDEWFAK